MRYRLLRSLSCLLIVFGVVAPAAAATAVWDASVETNVTGYLFSYGTQPGSYTTTIDVGNVLTYQFAPPAGQKYYLVVQAYSAAAVSETSNEVVLDLTLTSAPNLPPTLSQPPNQVTVVNTAASLTLSGSDPEGRPLGYQVAGLPAGLNVSSTTGVISGTPTITGTFNVSVTLSDGTLTASRTFTWSVISPAATAPPPNQPPTLNQPANQSTTINASTSMVLTGTDPEGQALRYSVTGLPPGLNVNAASGVISGAPSTAGAFTVTASASDGVLSANRTFTWTVTAAADATPPTVSLSNPGSGATLSGKRATLSATSADAGGVANVRFMFNGSQLIGEDTSAPYTVIWDTTVVANGDYTLTAVARDIAGNIATSSAVSVKVDNKGQKPRGNSVGDEGNGASQDDAPAQPTAAPEDELITLSGDFDGDGRPDPATFHPATGAWRIWQSSNSLAEADPITWGASGDVPVPADYDGDRRTDVALFRPSTGTWYLLLSSRNMQSRVEIAWGGAADVPLALDVDGDGKADLALARGGSLEILLSARNYTTTASRK